MLVRFSLWHPCLNSEESVPRIIVSTDKLLATDPPVSPISFRAEWRTQVLIPRIIAMLRQTFMEWNMEPALADAIHSCFRSEDGSRTLMMFSMDVDPHHRPSGDTILSKIDQAIRDDEDQLDFNVHFCGYAGRALQSALDCRPARHALTTMPPACRREGYVTEAQKRHRKGNAERYDHGKRRETQCPCCRPGSAS